MSASDTRLSRLEPVEWKRRCSVLSDRIARERTLGLPWPQRREAVLALARLHRYPPESLEDFPIDEEEALGDFWQACERAAPFVTWRCLADCCAEEADKEEAQQEAEEQQGPEPPAGQTT